MTNRTPKIEYDANPGLANDQNADYRIPGSKIEASGTAVPVSMSIQQMRSLVGNVDNPTPPPAAGSFSAVMQADNQLLVSITATIDFTADQYTYTIAGVSKTVTGTVTGTFSTTDTLADWNTNTITMTAINAADQSTVTLTPSIDNGSGGFDVQANDTIDPVFPLNSLSVSSGANAETEIDFTLTAATDSGSGISSYDAVATNTATGEVVTIVNGGLSGTFSGLNPGNEYSISCIAYDTFGNFAVSNAETITTASTSTAGIIDLTSATYTATDSTYVIQPVLQRTGGSSGAIQVTWSTADRVDDAIGGTPYTFNSTTGVGSNQISLDSGDPWVTQDPVTYSIDGGSYTTLGPTDAGTYYVRRISAGVYTLHPTATDAENNNNVQALVAGGAETQILFDGEDVAYEKVSGRVQSWADADAANKTLSIKLTKRAHAYNNVFDVQVDHASNSAGAIGSQKAANCTIDSSASGVAGFQQASDGTDNLLVIECENYDTSVADTGDATHIWNVLSDSRDSPSGTGSNVQPTSGSGAKGSSTSLDANAPYLEFDCNFTQSGTHYYWLRMFVKTSTTADTVHLSYDGGSDATLLGFYAGTVALSTDTHYKWVNVNSSSTVRSLSATTGAHTIRLYQQDYGVRVDKIVVTTNASYDPNDAATGRGDSKDDYFGPAESSRSSSSAPTDNPDNPTTPWVPLPSTTVSATALSPSNSSTDISTTSVLLAQFPSTVTNLTIQTLTVTVSGVEVSGAVSTTANTVTFTPASPLSNSSVYTITGTGHCIDGNGDLQALSFGTWSFTTKSAGTGGAILQDMNFTGATGMPRLLTTADVDTYLGTNTYGGITPDYDGELWLADDPLSTGRSPVLHVKVPLGGNGNIMQMRTFPISGTPDDLYMAMDLYIPIGYQCPLSVHLFGFISALDNIPHTGTTPDNDPQKALAAFNLYSSDLYDRGQGAGNAALACYAYYSSQYGPMFWNSDDPVNRWHSSSSSVGQVILPYGSWNRLELRAKLNTFTGATPNADGIIQGWLNGQLVLNRNNVTFLDEDNGIGGWNTIWNNTTYGGAGAVALQDDDVYIDNAILSTGPITH